MRFVLSIVAVLLLAGCARGADDTTTTVVGDLEPTQVVADWLQALEGPDVATLEPLVEPAGLAVVAAVENSLRSDDLVGLLTTGLGDDLATGYWTSFRDDFAAIRGEPLSAVVIGNLEPVPGIADHVAVAISTSTSEGRIVLRRGESGWQIDFAATVGPALIGPLGDYLDSALHGEHASEVAAAYADAVLPGLEAASALDQGNKNLAFEIEYIRQLTADVS
jgi:hypothetical protein